MRHVLQRHPVPVNAWFERCLVLTYACPAKELDSLLVPGLSLDTHRGCGFVAVALVQVRDLRPAFVPRMLGRDFFLAGFRVFVRFKGPDGRTRRGLRILRSLTDRRCMRVFGNLLTHYDYRPCEVQVRSTDNRLDIRVDTPVHDADLHVVTDLRPPHAPIPAAPFADWGEARRFAGPLPFTFDYEPQTHSIIVIKGMRERWHPEAVTVRVLRNTFFDGPPFDALSPRLVSAFHLAGVPYRWERGVRRPLRECPS